MSTTPQLSPLEQLAASGSQQPSAPSSQPQSNLSPLERLAAQKPAQQPSQVQGSSFTPDADSISTGGEGSNSDQQLMSDASQADATKKGLIIGGTGAAAVGGLAAPALVAAGPALVDAAGEPIVQTSASMLKQFGENYPELTKLAGKLGFGAGAASAWQLFNHILGAKNK
jgi:hypothetical protein